MQHVRLGPDPGRGRYGPSHSAHHKASDIHSWISPTHRKGHGHRYGHTNISRQQSTASSLGTALTLVESVLGNSQSCSERTRCRLGCYSATRLWSMDGLDGWMDGWILLNLPEHDQVGHDYLAELCLITKLRIPYRVLCESCHVLFFSSNNNFSGK